MTSSSKAIVLSFQDFGEADRYIQMFTQKWGMITALAKSARKSKRRYVGGLDLFCHNEIFLRGEPKNKPYLTELVVLNSFPGIREYLEKLMVAGVCAQWVKTLADTTIPMDSVYRLLGQTFTLIEKETDFTRLELLQLVFKLKLLSVLGLKPSVDECVRCQGTEFLSHTEFYFEMSSGGLVCTACLSQNRSFEKIEMQPQERQFLNSMASMKLSLWNELTFPQSATKNLSRLLTQFASYHTHVKLPI